jgi:hypothetical protein
MDHPVRNRVVFGLNDFREFFEVLYVILGHALSKPVIEAHYGEKVHHDFVLFPIIRVKYRVVCMASQWKSFHLC